MATDRQPVRHLPLVLMSQQARANMYFTGTIYKNNNGTHSETKSSLDPPANVVEQLDFVLSHPQHQIMVCVHDRKRKYIEVTAT